MAPSGAAQSVHLVRQPTGASSLVSHQKITSSLFGVATKTSHTMLPGIIGNRHWRAHRAIPGADLGRKPTCSTKQSSMTPGRPEHPVPAEENAE
ncbi:hypothetical protein B9M81_21205 [Mycobacteroides abscessus]|nr:hypothetical protein CAK77_21455 [Mycobacteroides abscessus subsp. massiliense]OTQ92010.1 hypothetical protein B9M86_21195 [Mycobacteroides abscessus]ORA90283.1 hypothetical protein BST32_10930 [Mycobacteroides abscessus subsp. massiliense]OTQ92556.1 hypothetical protein B9M84_20915 [Mycobacteroides abscessus]OTR03279.1 hypothetical protein B9M83_22125 [Mycobacteroides abscessus]